MKMPNKPPLTIDDNEYLEALRKKKTFPLHLHIDGSIPVGALFSMAKKRKLVLKLPEKDANGQGIMYNSEEERIINSKEKLREFQYGLLSKYHINDVFDIPISFMQTRDDIVETCVALSHYLKTQNSPYAEARFAPQYHLTQGLSLTQVIGYALEGLGKGKEDTGVTTKLIVSIDRKVDVGQSTEIVQAALCFKDEIVGIDLACVENGNPPEKHYDAVKLTFGTPLKRTFHAGEMCSEEENLKNIYTSLTLMQAHGISHAIPLHKRFYKNHRTHDLIEMMIRNGVRLESNPISNYNFFINSVADLYLDKLLDDGVLVTINPDDPAMWPQGDLVYGLYHLGKLYGPRFVDKVIRNSILCAWGLKTEEKMAYLKEAM